MESERRWSKGGTDFARFALTARSWFVLRVLGLVKLQLIVLSPLLQPEKPAGHRIFRKALSVIFQERDQEELPPTIIRTCTMVNALQVNTFQSC